MMVIFLVGLVSMILMRTLKKDYQRYSRDEEMDDVVRAAGRRFESRITLVFILFFRIFVFFLEILSKLLRVQFLALNHH